MKEIHVHKTKLVALLYCLLFLANSTPSRAELPAHHKVSIDAIETCLGKAKRAIEETAKKIPLISCDIPFSFKEAELDMLLNQAPASGDEPPENNPKATETKESKEGRLKSASKSTIKTLVNVKTAKCLAKVRLETATLQKAIDMKEGELTLPKQPITCDLQTRSNLAKQASFSFQPYGLFANGCIKKFSPQMGNFKLDCTFCRLKMVATTMSFWVNYIGSRMAPGINKTLGKSCKK